MWIEQVTTKDGTVKYKYCERYLDPYSNKHKKVSYTMSKNTKQAQNIARRELQYKIDAVTGFRAEPRTFHEVAIEWLDYIRPTSKISTYKNNELIVGRILRYIAPDVLLSKLDTITIQNLVNDVYLIKNLSYRYAERHLTMIKQIYKYAYRLNYVDNIGFLDRVELRKKPQTEHDITKKRLKFLDRDELKEVIRQLHELSPRIALMIEFIALTGLRYGECAALRLQDYHKEDKTVSINGSVSFCHTRTKGFERGTPKNVYSVRTVALDERCCAILNTIILENKKSSLWSNIYKNKEGYIFIAQRGNPYDLCYTNKLLKKVSVNDKKLTTHIFRHTHISMLAELGVPLKGIMERVGHNDPRTTLAIYSHVTKNMQADIINKLNAINL